MRLAGRLCCALIATASAFAVAHAESASAYKQTAAVPIGAPDRWDYLVDDEPAGRLYIAHGDKVTVLDTRALKVVGEVVGMSGGTHGIAVSAANNLGVTDDGKNGKAVTFDLKTLKVKKVLDAAPDADAIAGDPKSGHIFVANGDTGTLTVVDPAADAVAATVQIGGSVEYAVADGAGALYVNGAEKSEIVKVDTATNQVVARWPVPDCAKPHGLAIDIAHHRLFTTCVNSRMEVLDTTSGKVVATTPIGAGTDAAAYDATRHRVFSSNGKDGTISIISQVDPNTYKPLETLKTVVGARTMSIEPHTGRLFVGAGEPDTAAGPASHKIMPGSLKVLVFEPVH